MSKDSNSLNSSQAVVYEVIRIIGGIPLFLSEHLLRMEQSVFNTFKTTSKINDVRQLISQHIKDTRLINGNIEIQFKENSDVSISTIPHRYPTEEMFREGVFVGVLQAVREDPQTKKKNQSLRSKANQIMEENGFYEVLLIDDKGFFSEGSRSNVFFVKNEAVITPPSKAVLQGITRDKIFSICHHNNIPLTEQPLSRSYLPQFDAAFLTGTSPSVLPIQQIEKHRFHANNHITISIREHYKKLIIDDLDNFKW